MQLLQPSLPRGPPEGGTVSQWKAHWSSLVDAKPHVRQTLVEFIGTVVADDHARCCTGPITSWIGGSLTTVAAVPSGNDPDTMELLVIGASTVFQVAIGQITSCLCCSEWVASVVAKLPYGRLSACTTIGPTVQLVPDDDRECSRPETHVRLTFRSVEEATVCAAIIEGQWNFITALWPPFDSRNVATSPLHKIQSDTRWPAIAYQSMYQLALASQDTTEGNVTMRQVEGMKGAWIVALPRSHAFSNPAPPILVLGEAIVFEYGMLSAMPHVNRRIALHGSCERRLAAGGGGVSALSHPRVTEIHLDNHCIQTWDRFLAALHFPLRPTWSNITALYLCGSPVPAAVLEQLFTPLVLPSGLVELGLRNASLDDACIGPICRFVATSPTLVRVLCLDGNAALSLNAFEALGAALDARLFPLQRLTIKGCGGRTNGPVLGPTCCNALSRVAEVELTGTRIASDPSSTRGFACFRGSLAASVDDFPNDTHGNDMITALFQCPTEPLTIGLLSSRLTVTAQSSAALRRLAQCGQAVGARSDGGRRSMSLSVGAVAQPLPIEAVQILASVAILDEWSAVGVYSMEAVATLLQVLPECVSFVCCQSIADMDARQPPLLYADTTTMRAHSMRAAVESHQCLKRLHIVGLRLGNALLTQLGEALKKNRTITDLNFDRNDTTQEGWLALRKCLYGNKKLCSIEYTEDYTSRIRYVNQRIKAAQDEELRQRSLMKHAFRMRNRVVGRRHCDLMVRQKATIRTLRKQLDKIQRVVAEIRTAVARNVAAAAPKHVKEQERLLKREEKRARREAQEEARWEARCGGSSWCAPIENGNVNSRAGTKKSSGARTSTSQQAAPVQQPFSARLRPPSWQAIRDAAVFRVPEERRRRGLTSLSNRISAFVAHLHQSGILDAEFVALECVLPQLEAWYAEQHQQYVAAVQRVALLQMPSGWVATTDMFGNRCFANPSSGFATYSDPRLLRECPSFFNDTSDVGQVWHAVLLQPQPIVRDQPPLATYTYNLYLKLFFADVAFPLPRERGPFLFNIPVLSDATMQALNLSGQHPVVFMDPPRLLTPPAVKDAPTSLRIMSPRLFFAVNGLTSDLFDSIQSSEYATLADVGDGGCDPYWSLHLHPTISTLMADALRPPGAGALSDSLLVLLGLQDVYRQIEFNAMPAVFSSGCEALRQRDRGGDDDRQGLRRPDGNQFPSDDDDDKYIIGAVAMYLGGAWCSNPSARSILSTTLPIEKYSGATLECEGLANAFATSRPAQGQFVRGMPIATPAVLTADGSPGMASTSQMALPTAPTIDVGAPSVWLSVGEGEVVPTGEEEGSMPSTDSFADGSTVSCNSVDDADMVAANNSLMLTTRFQKVRQHVVPFTIEASTGTAAVPQVLVPPPTPSFDTHPLLFGKEHQHHLIEEYVKAPKCLFPSIGIRRHTTIAHRRAKFVAAAVVSNDAVAVLTQCSTDRLDRLERLGASLRNKLPYGLCALPTEKRDGTGFDGSPSTTVNNAAVALVASVYAPFGEDVAAVKKRLVAMAQRLVREKHCATVAFLLVEAQHITDAPIDAATGCCALYPINALSNLALTHAQETLRTPLGLLVDVDFAVRGDAFDPKRSAFVHSTAGRALFARLLGAAASTVGAGPEDDHVAVVLPAFEAVKATATTAVEANDATSDDTLLSKAAMLAALDEHRAEPFHAAHYPVGHGPTNVDAWRRRLQGSDNDGHHRAATPPTEFYEATYELGYEPYVLVPLGAIPRYDARFVGYGFNKVQHLLHMHQRGFRFYVSPDAFVVSTPHDRSSSWVRTFDAKDDRFLDHQKLWLQALFYRFQREIGFVPCVQASKEIVVDAPHNEHSDATASIACV